jgi:hypothetical protein
VITKIKTLFSKGSIVNNHAALEKLVVKRSCKNKSMKENLKIKS